MGRALVTGASGFVGAVLARRLLADGHEVHLLLRPGRRSWRVDEIADDVHIHALDLRYRGGVREAVRSVRPEQVFHLAAHGAYATQTDVEEIVGANVLGCMNLMDACAEVGVQAFVQTGSSSEYGYKNHPAVETEPIEPNSVYAVTKAAATHYCQFIAKSRDLHAVTVRLYSIYGPYEEPTRFIPTLIARGLRNELPPLVAPSTARDFVFVEDAVDAILGVASGRTLARGSVYNVCSGVQTTVGEVVEVARRLFGMTAEPVWASMPGRKWDTTVWVGSPDRMATEAGWRAAIPFEAGFKKTAEWWQAYRADDAGQRSNR